MLAFEHISKFSFDPTRHHTVEWLAYIIDVAKYLVLFSQVNGNNKIIPSTPPFDMIRR